jgi:HTH-type transcriptional regulator / antitoxin HigA
MMTENKEFQPDWFSAPGETIADILEERNLSTREFAQRIECTPEYVEGLLRGYERITRKTALQLEATLGASATFWMNRESQYREDMDRLQREAGEKWLSELPVSDMSKFGWVESFRGLADKVTACLRFFDVPDIRAWRKTYSSVLEMEAIFRTSPSFDSKPGSVAAWLRQGEIEASAIDCKPWDLDQFRAMLSRIRPLTRERDPNVFIPEIRRLCAECGVAVVILRAPDGCRASGATRFLSPNKALLLLSFRYLSDDHFWFTFFHEAGHLLLHSKNALFLEGADRISTTEEDEANTFAARILIPDEFQEELLNLPVNGREVMRFAKRVGVSPGIVVGQLQHRKIFTQRQLNNLKTRFTWKKNQA